MTNNGLYHGLHHDLRHWLRLKPTPLILLLGLALSPAVVSATNESFSSVPSSISSTFAELNALTFADYQWIGQKIYQNECAGKPKYLTYWGPGESFPSFGIGHFIWHPKKMNNAMEETFTETFPAMFEFIAKTAKPPEWLNSVFKNSDFVAPWSDKKEFDQAWSNSELHQLRDWLLATQSQQAQFIVLGFQQRWSNEIQTLPNSQKRLLQPRLHRMMTFKKGLFAVVDYFNFKGIGANQKEQYQGQSWGLASVLMAMDVLETTSQDEYLEQFVIAAKKRLQLRVNLAPSERNEARWLKGWEVRLDQYLK